MNLHSECNICGSQTCAHSWNDQIDYASQRNADQRRKDVESGKRLPDGRFSEFASKKRLRP